MLEDLKPCEFTGTKASPSYPRISTLLCLKLNLKMLFLNELFFFFCLWQFVFHFLFSILIFVITLRLVYIGGFVLRFRRTFSPKISIIFIPLASHFSFLGTLDTLDVTVSKIGNFLFFKPLRHKVGHLTYLGYN